YCCRSRANDFFCVHKISKGQRLRFQADVWVHEAELYRGRAVRFIQCAQIVSLTRFFAAVNRARIIVVYQEDHGKRVAEGGKAHSTEVHMKRDRSKWAVFLQISFGALPLGLFIGGVAFSQTSFFQGKTVTILESSAPGGVGSMRTKAVVPFLQKYIPGNPIIVMQYMDGGGGRKAANHLYTAARPDGLANRRMSAPFADETV